MKHYDFNSLITNRLLNILILILLGGSWNSCKNKPQYENAQTFIRNDFPEYVNLKGEYLDIPDIERPEKIYINESFLYVVNSQGSTNFLSIYNSKTLEKVGEYLPFGNGPGELIHCYQIQFLEDETWISDIVQKKILIYKKKQTINETFSKPDKTLTFQEVSILNPLALDSNRIVINDSQSENQLLTFINSNEEKENRNIPFPYHNKISDSPFFLERIFECRTTVDPITNYIYVTYVYTDLIDIYDSEGNLIKRLHGPEQYFPILQDSQNELGRFAAVTKETKASYFVPTITSNNFWTIFIGEIPSRNTLASELFKFSKKGDLETLYKLDTSIFNFCIDELNNKIYALTNYPDYTVISFDL